VSIITSILPRFVDEQGASEITGIPTATLQTKRVRGSGPPFVKVGRSVRYEVDDLVEWMRQLRGTSTADVDQRKARAVKDAGPAVVRRPRGSSSRRRNAETKFSV
jgi:hypothetical protein